MPRTATKEEVLEQANEVAAQTEAPAIPQNAYPYPVHTIIRGIVGAGVPSNPKAGVFSIEEVDAYLASWYADGYRLQSAHYGGQTKEPIGGSPAHNMIYVLVRD